jgi:hypothetical protein
MSNLKTIAKHSIQMGLDGIRNNPTKLLEKLYYQYGLSYDDMIKVQDNLNEFYAIVETYIDYLDTELKRL